MGAWLLLDPLLLKAMVAVPPKVLHYGLLWEVDSTPYKFDKHWHNGFDALQCPPWNLNSTVPAGGLFPHPPGPKTFQTKVLNLMFLP